MHHLINIVITVEPPQYHLSHHLVWYTHFIFIVYTEHNFVLQEFILQDIVHMALQKGSH